METKVTRFSMGQDVVQYNEKGEVESGSPGYHVSLWYKDADGNEHHRRRSFPEDASLEDVLEGIKDYEGEDWTE